MKDCLFILKISTELYWLKLQHPVPDLNAGFPQIRRQKMDHKKLFCDTGSDVILGCIIARGSRYMNTPQEQGSFTSQMVQINVPMTSLKPY